jgi:MOSC domain-containing protein YiiM
MNSMVQNLVTGSIASLHLHPSEPGEPFHSVASIDLIAAKGIAGNPRYFGRVSRSTGKPSRRQISLIEREQLAGHAAVLGLPSLPPGAARANIETLGINLIALIGHRVRIGDAVLFLYEARDPCDKMDAVAPGLKDLMRDSRQGVLAEVIETGCVRVGDRIEVLPATAGVLSERTPHPQ